MLGFAEKVESHLERADSDLVTAKASIASLSADLAAKDSEITTLKAQITESAKTIETLGADIAARDLEIVNLRAEVEKQKGKANETIAAQGLPADSIPITITNTDAPGTVGETAWQKYQRLLGEDSRAAGAFYNSHRKEIFQSKQ